MVAVLTQRSRMARSKGQEVALLVFPQDYRLQRIIRLHRRKISKLSLKSGSNHFGEFFFHGNFEVRFDFVFE